jgi:ATP-dependent protease HslVU (ClpYQ) peptidase subunit
MTCIVGIVEEGVVYLAGDSAGVNGVDIDVRAYPKVFKNNEFLIGYADSFRIGQILQYVFVPPKLTKPKAKNILKFMVSDFITVLRKCLQEEASNSKDDAMPVGPFLIGVCGRLFSIDSDYQVCELVDGYYSIGCGSSYALGSMHTTKGHLTPEDRLLAALEAAEHHSAGVIRPFTFIDSTQ